MPRKIALQKNTMLFQERVSTEGTSVLQQGQSGWMASQGRTQSEWYLWEHGSRVTRCRSRTSSRHTAQTSVLDSVLLIWAPRLVAIVIAGTEQGDLNSLRVASARSCCCSCWMFCCLELAPPSRSRVLQPHLHWFSNENEANPFTAED
jgi:hypothetical protein